jgi:hypothetical protein
MPAPARPQHNVRHQAPHHAAPSSPFHPQQVRPPDHRRVAAPTTIGSSRASTGRTAGCAGSPAPGCRAAPAAASVRRIPAAKMRHDGAVEVDLRLIPSLPQQLLAAFTRLLRRLQKLLGTLVLAVPGTWRRSAATAERCGSVQAKAMARRRPSSAPSGRGRPGNPPSGRGTGTESTSTALGRPRRRAVRRRLALRPAIAESCSAGARTARPSLRPSNSPSTDPCTTCNACT